MIDYKNKKLIDEWSLYDVEAIVDEWADDGTTFEPALTEEEAFKVLIYIDKHFDAYCGVNWDVIENALEELYGDREVR